MDSLEKKQKIILGIMIAIVVGFIGYYVYAKEDQKQLQEEEEFLLQPTETKEKQEEK